MPRCTDSSVASGPGSTCITASRRLKRVESIRRSSSTSAWRIIAICAIGPPKARQPKRRNFANSAASERRGGAGSVDDIQAPCPGARGARPMLERSLDGKRLSGRPRRPAPPLLSTAAREGKASERVGVEVLDLHAQRGELVVDLAAVADDDDREVVGPEVLARGGVDLRGVDVAVNLRELRLVIVGPAEQLVVEQRRENLAVGLEAVRQAADVAVGDALQLGLVDAPVGGEGLHLVEDQADRVGGAVGLDGGQHGQRARTDRDRERAADAVSPALLLAQVQVEPREKAVADDLVGEVE